MARAKDAPTHAFADQQQPTDTAQQERSGLVSSQALGRSRYKTTESQPVLFLNPPKAPQETGKIGPGFLKPALWDTNNGVEAVAQSVEQRTFNP